MLEQKNVTVKAGSSFQTICPFPVGYIYQSYNSTSPANIYGGSWTPITGRFLYCNNGTGVGGSNTQTITTANLPAHSHSINIATTAKDGQSSYGLGTALAYHGRVVVSFDDGAHKTNTNNSGSGSAVNNMPAYQTCYAWRRTN